MPLISPETQELISHFHPVLIHLPIGFFILGVVFIVLDFLGYAQYIAAAKIAFGFGILGAVLSALTGYLLLTSGDYQGEMIENHKWGGFMVTGYAIVIFIMLWYNFLRSLWLYLGIGVIILLTIVGHWGGIITHGSDYLNFDKLLIEDSHTIKEPTDKNIIAFPINHSEKLDSTPLKSKILEDTTHNKSIVKNKENSINSDTSSPSKNTIPIEMMEHSTESSVSESVYQSTIMPLFDKKCNSCHGENKRKGGLRMDSPEFLIKGGKNGAIIVSGNPSSSELFKRILLPLEDDDHMPPAEKIQCSEQEITQIKDWIQNGIKFK